MTETIQNLAVVPHCSEPAQPRPCPPPPKPVVNLPSFETIDRVGRSLIARFTAGISPHAEADAWFDWCSHFSRAPGRQLELVALGAVMAARLAALMTGGAVPLLRPEPIDHRFDDEAWQKFPFLWWQQAFLAQEEWWRSATRPLRGMKIRDAERVGFMIHQYLDAFSPPFGNVVSKMDTTWRERGGVPAYRRHVREIVEKFGHISLHEQTWKTDVPKSSMPAHIFLCAIRRVELSGRCRPSSGDRAAWAVREAFFRQGRDISNERVLLEIAESIGLPAGEIENAIATGAAHAALSEDLELARTQSITASPTLLFNEGRQRLTGNVGYRIIEANIRELLEGAPGQLSWC